MKIRLRPPEVDALLSALSDVWLTEVTDCTPIRRRGRTYWEVTTLTFERRDIKRRHLECAAECGVDIVHFHTRPVLDDDGITVVMHVRPLVCKESVDAE